LNGVLWWQMSKRRSQRNIANHIKQKSKFRFEAFSVSEEDHPKLKASMHAAALESVAAFPKTLELVKDQLRRHDPIGIMACFAGYALITTVGSRDGSKQNPLKDILQHHAELLQAIMLTITPDQWGPAPVVPGAMQIVFDSLPKLSDTFLLQRILEAEKVSDEQELAVLSLQERIRLHTMGVRNWGHFDAVIRISKELYGAIDGVFASHHGFSCTDFIEVMHCAFSEFERRQTEHWNRFRRVLRGRNPRQIFRLYFKNVPGLVGSAEDMLAALPGIDVDGAKAAVIAHYDLRLSDCGTFKPDDIAKLSGRTSQVVESVFRAVSLPPGALAEAKAEYLFLGNPVWEAPAIDLGTSFFLPMPQAVFSHIHRIMDRLAGAAGLKEAAEKARSSYLQEKLEATLRSALPGAVIMPGAKWKIGDQVFETDVLVVIDRTVIAAEAKANRLTPEGLRGAPARVKRHVRDMVLAPSVQSERLANLITKAQSGDTASIAIVTGLGINPEAVDRVIRLSVTLDDLSVLSAAEGEFKKVGWVPTDHDLAPTVLIADLLCIVDILNKPLLLLHYLSERTHFQKGHNLLGDELDFLGLYLENGFNFVLADKDILFTPTGMSGPIDRYYEGLDAGIAQSKPKPNLSALFTQIIDRLNERRPGGWTTVGLHLLGAASPSEQRRVERSLDKLRAMVRKNYRDPGHINSMQIQPPLKHKARVGFYLFPEQLRAESRRTMERLSDQALDTDGVEAIVLFARSTEKWEVPYEAVLYAKKR
jgi:hypothetical protein